MSTCGGSWTQRLPTNTMRQLDSTPPEVHQLPHHHLWRNVRNEKSWTSLWVRVKGMVIEMAFQPRVNLLILHCGRSFLKPKAGPPPWQQSSPLLSDHRTQAPVYILHSTSMVIRNGTSPRSHFPPLTLFEASAFAHPLHWGVLRGDLWVNTKWYYVAPSSSSNATISWTPLLPGGFCFIWF